MPSNMRFMNPDAIAKPGGYSHVVEITGLYWHFVDLVWIMVFTLMYLL